MNLRSDILLNDLWIEEKCPIIDGVFFDDGTIIKLEISEMEEENKVYPVIERLFLNQFLNSDEWINIYETNLKR